MQFPLLLKYKAARLGTIVSEQPSQSAVADSVSLRLGHGSALTSHCDVIHSLAAASLPVGKGGTRSVPERVKTKEDFLKSPLYYFVIFK